MKELLRNKIDNEAIRRMQDQPSMVRHPFRIVKIYEGEKEREYVSNVWYLCKKKDSLVRLAEIHFYADNIDDAFCEIQAILNLNEKIRSLCSIPPARLASPKRSCTRTAAIWSALRRR